MKKGGTRRIVPDLGPPSRNYIAISIELPVPTTAAEVERHNRSVRQRGSSRACYRESCGRCREPGQFAPHDVRRRTLRLIVGHNVVRVPLWLARWRCRECRYVFTDYPDFRTPL